MADYKWRENPACVATYNLLGDKFLDQFETDDTPFKDAGALKLEELLYFLHTTANARIRAARARRIARKLLTLLTGTYTVGWEAPGTQNDDVFFATAAVFEDGSKTLTDVAALIDGYFRFPTEVAA